MQYFQFDEQGNMFMYEAGAGFSGQCKLVRQGDELFTDVNVQSSTVEPSGCLIDKREGSDGMVNCSDFQMIAFR